MKDYEDKRWWVIQNESRNVNRERKSPDWLSLWVNGQTQGTLGGQNDMLSVSGGTKEEEKREEGMRAAAWCWAGTGNACACRDSTSCGGLAALRKAAAASDSTPSDSSLKG